MVGVLQSTIRTADEQHTSRDSSGEHVVSTSWDWLELSIVSRTLVINSLSQLFVVEYMISQMIVMWNGRTRLEG